MSQMSSQETLSRAEYDSFQSRRLKVLLGGVLGFAFAIAVAITVNLFHVEPHPVVLGVGSFVCVIWLLVQMFKYKCPRCGTTPMTTRLTFGNDETAEGGFLALFPKKCSKCGVLFTTACSQDADAA